MISFISQEYNKDLPPFFASVFVSYTNWLWWKGNKYIWDSMILEYIIFIQRLLRRVLLFLIQINYLHTNLSKNKVYVIVISYEKEFLKNISKLFWYNKICITFTTALLPSSLQKKSNMNKKNFCWRNNFCPCCFSKYRYQWLLIEYRWADIWRNLC